jgi:RimJ/RimL family protein N-acetyltransferase
VGRCACLPREVREEDPGQVTLVVVDEAVLEELVGVATTDAAADEVTPPLSADGGWTPARVRWLRSFHRDRHAGLDGPAQEATWAVVVGERVVGAVRLRWADRPGVLETGIWLSRQVRGRGVAGAALAAVLQQAAAAGAVAVGADTTAGNAAALAVLSRAGFELSRDDDGRAVRALLLLQPPA